MESPLVSVVIATRNRLETLKEALGSVLSQEYSNLEVILVDDCSDWETEQGIKKISGDKRIKIIRNAENIGFVRSLNKGIKEAKGVYIARIDDDDVWINNEKIKKQVSFLENNPQYVLASGGIIRIDGSGKEISREIFPEFDWQIRSLMLITDPMVHVAAMFKKEDWEKTGGYDEKFDYSQDWELWMRLGKMGKCYNFQEFFVRSLFLGEGRSRKNMRYHLWLGLEARRKHKGEFPNFWKGYAAGWLSYLFSFIPVRFRVGPFFLSIKKIFLFKIYAKKN